MTEPPRNFWGQTAEERDAWKVGFDQMNGGMCCHVCGALVPHQPAMTQKHRDWHAANDRAPADG